MSAVDDLVVEVSEILPAAPERVWDLLSDVERMAGLGPEHAAATWDSPERGIGAGFTGVNERCGRRWEMPCRVTESARPDAFAWEVGDPASPTGWWSYRLTAVEGGTRVEQRFAHGPGRSFLRHVAGKHPEQAEQLVADRAADLAANMRSVLRAAAALL